MAFRSLYFFPLLCICSALHAQQGIPKTQPQPALQSINTFNKENKEINLQPLPPAFYTQHLPFFCRQELKMEHTLHTPVKIRVGSIESCNYLEQKPGYQYLSK